MFDCIKSKTNVKYFWLIKNSENRFLQPGEGSFGSKTNAKKFTNKATAILTAQRNIDAFVVQGE